MNESAYCFEVPFQLLQLLLAVDKKAVYDIQSLGALHGPVEDGKHKSS